jgi:hypothetical protein
MPNRTRSANWISSAFDIIDATIAIIVLAIALFCCGFWGSTIAPCTADTGFDTVTTIIFAWSSQRIILASAFGVIDVAIAIIIFTIADLFCGRREWLTCSPRGI